MPKITKFKGLKNTETADRLKPGELVTAQNIDITNTERIQTRQGQTVVQALTNAHSIWSHGRLCLFVQGGALKRLLPDETVATIKALVSNNLMAYEAGADGVAYYTNGVDLGRVVNGVYSCWGVPAPLQQPTAAVSAGSLPPGKYLYALTFVRSDGLEGGTGLSGEIELTTKSGIQFSGIEVSANAEITGKQLYLSTPNGEVLYRAQLLANATTTFLYQGDSLDLTGPLTTQFASPPPAGHMVGRFNGSLYVCTGNLAYQSDPYAYETFRLADKFMQFTSKLTMFAGLNSSIWASTDDDRVFHLNGEQPEKMTSKEVDAGSAIPGTVVITTASILAKTEATSGTGADEAGTTDSLVAMWASDRGIYVGYETGEAHNLTETTYSYGTAPLGAAMVRLLRGYTQYVVTLKGAGAAQNAAS